MIPLLSWTAAPRSSGGAFEVAFGAIGAVPTHDTDST